MNHKPEITKIKVNNGQELIQKAQEYKNSGGKWKLLENYFTVPSKGQTNQEKGWSLKNNSEGIKISNGKQEVEIYFEGLKARINFNLTGEWDEVKQIFPEISQTCFDDSMPFQIPGKKINKGEEKIFLSRALTAWSVGDIFKIIADYYEENEAEIKKEFASLGFETSLKHWIKVGNDADGNIFIWLGKREAETINVGGGGELQISINRKDLERYSTGSYSRGGTIFWKDLNNQQLANELLEMRIEPFWGLINSGGKKGTISVYDDHRVGFTPTPFENNPDLPGINYTYTPKPKKKKHNEADKNQLLQYFLDHNIAKISIENGKLKIEYSSQGATKAVDHSELDKYKKLIQNQPNHTLSLTDLQKNDSNPNHHKLIVGLVLGAGAVLLIGTIAYFWNRRRKKRG